MSGLAVEDFGAFFAAVHGCAPFPWQTRLAAQVAAASAWPATLDLPTGAGKTAAIDIAVFHLALQAGMGAMRGAPCRIVFVVDRRLIVDDAHARAQKIAAAINGAGDGVLLKMKRALAALAEDGEEVLVTRRLRGGAALERDLARTPSQPTVICSTVDQVGSRLLFRGYGVSETMRPVHAGLLGGDCLYLLDEAHLAQPFRQTLEAVGELRGGGPPFQVALLSATPGESGEEAFALDHEDRENGVLRERIQASKPARLVPIQGERGKDDEQQRVEALVSETLGALARLREGDQANPAIGVVVNRVLRARRIFEALRNAFPAAEDGAREVDIDLLIGPARGLDREVAAHRLEAIKTGRPRAAIVKPRIVVATQTIEVGVDLDLDGLVTEAAALDALRQRFGRVNRAGRKEFTPISAIVGHKDDVGKRADDPVYGDAAAATWDQLVAWGGEAGCVDFGVEAMNGHLASLGAGGASLCSPRKNAPMLMPAHADIWAQTSPAPAVDMEPDLNLFLHGPRSGVEGVSIVWRGDIVREGKEQKSMSAAAAAAGITTLKLAPPSSGEALEIGLVQARVWLMERAPVDLADAPEQASEPEAEAGKRSVIRWAGPDSGRTTMVGAADLRPGDVIVAPSWYGGCDDFGWAPRFNEDVPDIGNLVPRRGRVALRLTPALLAYGLRRELAAFAGEELIANAVANACRALNEALETDAIDVKGLLAAIREAIIQAAPQLAAEAPPFVATLMAMAEARGVRAHDGGFARGKEGERAGVVLVGGVANAREIASTSNDDLGSANGTGQELDDHLKQVADVAYDFAKRSLVSDVVARSAMTAALLHDLGKADPRFQLWLHDGDPFDPVILAKSRGAVSLAARKRSRLPDRWRHEALSVRMAEVWLRGRNEEGIDPELVLWLVGTHHGYGRPFFPHVDEDDLKARTFTALDQRMEIPSGVGPQSLAYDFEGLDWSALFELLKRRYGVWELARLEAIVRLADHRASERPQTKNSGKKEGAA